MARRSKEKALSEQKITQDQRDYLIGYLEKNRQAFGQTMRQLQKHSPAIFAKLYVDMSKLVVPKENNVKVSVGLSKDFMELKALAGCGFKNSDAPHALEVKSGQELPDFEDFAEIVSEETKEAEENGAKEFNL
jgi:hypothetical protein